VIFLGSFEIILIQCIFFVLFKLLRPHIPQDNADGAGGSYSCQTYAMSSVQDKKGKRQIPKQGYVNTEWFLKNITNSCNYCGCGFSIDIYKGGIMSNLTAQRVNNEVAHT